MSIQFQQHYPLWHLLNLDIDSTAQLNFIVGVLRMDSCGA